MNSDLHAKIHHRVISKIDDQRIAFFEKHMHTALKKVLIVGSAPDATRTADWDTSCLSHTIVINNAWMACPSWSCWIYPEDFPSDRHPSAEGLQGKKVVTAQEFVPVQNEFGGFVYAGGTMSFTAGYWALGALKPDVIAYIGCDMVYEAKPGQTTHFYGMGTADPLRSDVTLQSLEAKSLRFQALAHKNGCAVVNLSELESSRLCFPRLSFTALNGMTEPPRFEAQQPSVVQTALRAEADLGYWVESGRYWEEHDQFDGQKLRDIDALWMATAPDEASR
jgi:hypothetical protein